jgi:prepilin-type N-terminal cleavage/methylation domain-containing protein
MITVETSHPTECGMRKAACGMQNPMSRITHHASRPTPHAPRSSPAFTLLELLMVIAIMGILAAIALPSIRGLKPNAKVAATRQLLDAVGRARQLAVSQRTTVYMVFVPASFWTDPAYAYASWTTNDQTAAASLLDKQLIGYAYVCLRSVGDQPGMHTPRYLSSWKRLPQGAFIPQGKFGPGLTIPNTTLGTLSIPAFKTANNIPFPSETTPPVAGARPYIAQPYIAFNGTGQLVSGQSGQPELIPVSEGGVIFARDPNTKVAQAQPPQANEVPPGNTIDNYSLVYIDRLTGRAHVERRKVQ